MVRCRDCGFLAAMDPNNPGVALEALEECRADGRQVPPNGEKKKEMFLRCFRNARPLDIGPGKSQPRDTIDQEIECDKFTEWVRNKSPEKHEEMTIVQAMEQRTREWRDEDIRLQKSIQALYEQRHQELLDAAKQGATSNVRATVIAAFVGALVATAGLAVVNRFWPEPPPPATQTKEAAHPAPDT